MTTSRTTSQDERLRIVKDCLANGKTTLRQPTSTQSLTNKSVAGFKILELGEAGLEDRRGKRKANQEPRNELEEYKIKVAQLEKELYWTRAERDLLKSQGAGEPGSLSQVRQEHLYSSIKECHENLDIRWKKAAIFWMFHVLHITNGFAVIVASELKQIEK